MKKLGMGMVAMLAVAIMGAPFAKAQVASSTPATQGDIATLQSELASLESQLIALLQAQVAQLEGQLAALQQTQAEQGAQIAAIASTTAQAQQQAAAQPSQAQVAAIAPSDAWTPLGQYMVSNQFALDPNAAQEWLTGSTGYAAQKVMAMTTQQFTIAGRLTQLEQGPTQETWFPMPGVQLTITYGSQSQTATTDSNGVVSATFAATGIPGDHQFAYSAPGLAIADTGTVTEWALPQIAATSTQATVSTSTASSTDNGTSTIQVATSTATSTNQ